MRVVSAVFFDSSKEYDYFVPEGDNPQEGDLIITSLTVAYTAVVVIARIVRLKELSSKAKRPYLYLIPIAMLKDIEERQNLETQRLDDIRRTEEALEQYIRLKEKNRELIERAATYASDPKVNELLSKLKDLKGA